jgi:hypothetical protein
VGVLQPGVGVARTRAGYYADRSRTGERVILQWLDRSVMK